MIWRLEVITDRDKGHGPTYVVDMVIRAPEAIPMTPTAGPDAADSAPTGNASTCLCPWAWITPRRCVVSCPARIGTRGQHDTKPTPSRRQADAKPMHTTDADVTRQRM
ncbi:hypothetical protein PG988_006552 [Apiospora saccharicola]